MLKPDTHLYEFGPFHLDTSERLLLRDGVRVPLADKAFDTLVALIRRKGHLATKEELMTEVWPEAFVEENNLDKSVSTVRQALGDRPSAPTYVETVRGRGYRFLRPVIEVPGGEAILKSLGETKSEEALLTATQSAPTHRNRFKSLLFITGASVLVVGLSLATYFWLTIRAKRVQTALPPKSIAVLPFKPLASDSHDESLELGMADTLITKLGNLRDVTVRPISAVRKYTSLDQDSIAAGKELGVDAVLDGSMQRAGDRIRATVRLVRVADGVSLWAGTFDEKLEDIFTVQDSISEQVTRSLALRLSNDDERRLAKRYTENTEAYQLYLKGRYFWNRRTEESTRKSIDYFEQAVSLDRNYALAYSGLADAYWVLHIVGQGHEGEQLRAQAEAAALRALALDDTLAEAHTSLGEIKEVFDLDFQSAEREYKHALELDPNYAVGHQRYGYFLNRMGRVDEARTELKRALELDPLSPVINAEAARPFIRSRDYVAAIEQLKKAVELDPNYPRPHNLLALCYTRMGRYEEAVVEAQKAAALSAPSRQSGAVPTVSYQLAYIYVKAGRRREARRVLDELERSPAQRNDELMWQAMTYAALGERERALAQMKRLYESRNIDLPYLPSLQGAPAWDDLQRDPRFPEFLQRFGLSHDSK